jgi:hypothetical protein
MAAGLVARVVVWLGSGFDTDVNGEVITLGRGARS